MRTQEKISNGELAKTLNGEYADTLAAIRQVIAHGNLASLSEEGRLKYYAAICESAGLNPLTRPFEFIELKGKLVLYAKKDCTEQLRKIHGVSCEKIDHKKEDGLYIVTAMVKDKTGRTDISTGAIALNSEKGEQLANLIMKAETKAKRRATLSICGLGILDETEIESIPREKNITPSEQTKPEDYKLAKDEKSVDFATSEQVFTIADLSKKLQKDAGYVEKVVKVKFGHDNLNKIPKKFADEWEANLQKRVEDTQQFVKEMD